MYTVPSSFLTDLSAVCVIVRISFNASRPPILSRTLLSVIIASLFESLSIKGEESVVAGAIEDRKASAWRYSIAGGAMFGQELVAGVSNLDVAELTISIAGNWVLLCSSCIEQNVGARSPGSS